MNQFYGRYPAPDREGRTQQLAITLRQPWASLVACGAKDIENRGWSTNIRGRVYIHSSAHLDPSEMNAACELMASFVPNFSATRFKRDHFPLGAILGSVEIVDCVTHSDSPWFTGPFGFVLRNASFLAEPIDGVRGQLYFWDASHYLKEAIHV